MVSDGLVINIIFPVLCCYYCPSLGEGTWRKTLTDLSSANKKEMADVKKQMSKSNKNNICSCRKWIFVLKMRKLRHLFWEILIFKESEYI